MQQWHVEVLKIGMMLYMSQTELVRKDFITVSPN